jgi:hypothetical protein
MELIGEEKKIQTLFSELRQADEPLTPGFSATWNHAQAQGFRPRRAFNFSFVAATALLVCVLVSLAWWSRRWQRAAPPRAVAFTPVEGTPPLAASALAPVQNQTRPSLENRLNSQRLAAAHRRSVLSARLRAGKSAAQREETLLAAAKDQATAISNWQSPTATLLSSANDDLLKSLPKLNESTTELKSFLPTAPK